MNQKILRIVLCAICAIALVAFVFAPCITYGFEHLNFYKLLFEAGAPVVVSILGVLAILLLIATIIFSVIFKIGKNVVGSLAMLAGYFVLATLFAIPVGTVTVWGWGSYLCMFLGVAILAILGTALVIKKRD